MNLNRKIEQEINRLLLGETKGLFTASTEPNTESVTIEKLMEAMEILKKPVLSKIKGSHPTLLWLRRYIPERQIEPDRTHWPYFSPNAGGIPLWEDDTLYDGFLEFCDQYDQVMHRYYVYQGEMYEVSLEIEIPKKKKEAEKK